jgi:hypothetical protein
VAVEGLLVAAAGTDSSGGVEAASRNWEVGEVAPSLVVEGEPVAEAGIHAEEEAILLVVEDEAAVVTLSIPHSRLVLLPIHHQRVPEVLEAMEVVGADSIRSLEVVVISRPI